MPKMRAIDVIVVAIEREGIVTVFGMPGATINSLYSALHKADNTGHVLAYHVEGASHMAENYTRVELDNIDVCVGTSSPAGTDMVIGLYLAWANSIPTLCITGQASRVRLYKEGFQAVDIELIVKPTTKWVITVHELALVPRIL